MDQHLQVIENRIEDLERQVKKLADLAEKAKAWLREDLGDRFVDLLREIDDLDLRHGT
ncbi:hypothetical protein ES707_09937 [subsurface metagenome]